MIILAPTKSHYIQHYRSHVIAHCSPLIAHVLVSLAPINHE